MPTTNQALDDLIRQDLFKLLGLEAISEEEKAALYQKVLQTIQNRVIAQLIDQLSMSEAEQFGKLAEARDQAGLDTFLKDRHIDIVDLMVKEAILYKAELLALAKPFLHQGPPAGQSHAAAH